MKALILNSGLGSRMGEFTSHCPKCMTVLDKNDTILSRQLRLLKLNGINDVIITTGPYKEMLEEYCYSLKLDMNYTFVFNDRYFETNYIYSIFKASEYLADDIILIHGDLIFDELILEKMLSNYSSCMAVSSKQELSSKDFKAVISCKTGGGARIEKIGIEYFENAISAQPLYKIFRKDWMVWLERICSFCESGNINCYAENAFNTISDQCIIAPVDIFDALCQEIDDIEDLKTVKNLLEHRKIVYMCFSTDIIHGGHISIIDKASQSGTLIIGVLSDKAVASYKRYPLLSYDERKNIIRHISGVAAVVEQKQLSYAENLRLIRPDYVVHGDDWKNGVQEPIRKEAIEVINEYGGRLIEYPYSDDEKYRGLDAVSREQLSLPDIRRGRLKKLIELKGTITALESHSGITGLIAEKTTILQDGKTYQFDAIWISSLCDSTAKGKPDIELVDMTSRFRTVDDIMEVTTKPIIFDGDTGGLIEHFIYTVKSLERIGVSAVVIEDKTGLKRNSLFGTEAQQTQDTIEHFCAKISAGKKAQKSKDFMIIARIESLILDMGMDDALKRAFSYVEAGADCIMIHSRKKEPDEIFEFIDKFRKNDLHTPLVVVPTTFNSVTEMEWESKGVNIVIYANQLTRSGFPAMQKAASLILKNHRAKEADDICMSIKDIITLIPEQY